MIRSNFASALVAAFAISFLCMTCAYAGSTQQNKNLWRNLAIGSAGLAGVGLLNHNSTETIVGAAGAAYSANRYEHERRGQSRARAARRARWYRLHHRRR